MSKKISKKPAPEVLPPEKPDRSAAHKRAQRGKSQFTDKAYDAVTNNLTKANEGFQRYLARKRAEEAADPMKKLTYQELVFCHELMVELKMNYAGAARRAGFKGLTQGTMLMKKPHVRRYVEMLQQQRLKKLSLTADKVLTEISKVAFADMINYIHIGEDGSARVDLSRVIDHADRSAAMQEISVEEVQQKTGEVGDDGKPTWETVKKVRFKLGEKMKALELLGKNLALFTDRMTVSDPDGKALPAPVFKIEFVDPPPLELQDDSAGKKP